MFPPYITDHFLEKFIKDALQEDEGSGDHSSLASITSNVTNYAQLIIKDEGILAGAELAKRVFNYVDSDLQMEALIQDGEKVQHQQIAFKVKGKAQSILLAERLVLNCMQRMSGIATITNEYVEKVRGTKARILDTRKTTPNFRALEKWAVKIGGGTNHRYGLFDMIILKDNHVDYAGGIRNAIENTIAYLREKKLDLKIEIETRTLKEVEEVLQTGRVHRIMLDNMNNDTMRRAVDLIQGQFETEASGGVNLSTVRGIAETGVDYISVGALTHSIKSLDLSLKAIR